MTIGMADELSLSACWSRLRESPVGRLALQGDDDIEVFPVNYLVDGGTIVFRTAQGTKLALAEANERATFEADGVDVTALVAWSVVLKGPIRVVRGHDAILDSFDVDVLTWQVGPKPFHVRLSPDVVTGRQFAWAAPS